MPSQNASTGEADMESSSEQDSEHDISKEILELTERLAALHAKQECRRTAKSQEPARVAESSGGTRCPRSPQRRGPSPDRSESANKRKGRVVAAKFLHGKYEESSVKRSSDRFADENEKFNESPLTGKPNPPRKSLGTPARLLTRSPAGVRHRSISPSHSRHQTTTNFEAQSGISYTSTKVTGEDCKRECALLERGNSRPGTGGGVFRKNLEDDRKGWNSLTDRGSRTCREKEQRHRAPCLSTGGLGGTRGMYSHVYPKSERKTDWVKSLRSGPAAPSQPFTMAANSKSHQDLNERFTKQKSEKQDVNAWLGDHLHQSSRSTRAADRAEGDGNVLEDRMQKIGKKRRMTDYDQAPVLQTPSIWSTRPSNGFTSPLSSARPSTPGRVPTPNKSTTPSKKGGRIVPSRYGTPVRTTPSKTTPVRTSPGSRSVDLRPSVQKQGVQEFSSQIQLTPGKKYSKDLRDAMAARKSLPTTRRGYSAAAGVIDAEKPRTLKYQDCGVELSKHQAPGSAANAEGPRRPNSDMNPQENLFAERNGVIGTSEPASSCVTEVPSDPPPRKIHIWCSDFVKDKHNMLQMKGKLEYRLFRSQGMPRQGNEDGLVFSVAGNSNQMKTDFYTARQCENELGGTGQHLGGIRSVEERPYRRDAMEDVQLGTSSSSAKVSRMTEVDGVHDKKFGEGLSRPSALHLLEDYTLDIVDTLKSERECLPRIRATKDGAARLGHSPRDSGCIKRAKEGERRACGFFNGGSEDGGGSTAENQMMPPMET